MYWTYYSFGPQFIGAIAGMDWAKIDPIFTNLPVKTRETLHPDIYLANQRQQYVVDLMPAINQAFSSWTDSLFDYDEWGEVLWATLFREWGFTDYKTIASGIVSDRVAVANKPSAPEYACFGYTLWKDQAEAHEFFLQYRELLQKKYGVTLAIPSGSGAAYVMDDAANNMYLEQMSTNAVIFVEKAAATYKNTLLSGLRSTTATDWAAIAKAAASLPPYGRVPKTAKEDLWY
jgi:hypothetical protein